jgi:hypothetical protein
MSFNQIFNLVPVFDGSNYRKWADKMKVYLQMYNLWGITSGTEKQPTEPEAYRTGSGEQVQVHQLTAEQKAEYAQGIKEWTRDNKAALGAMMIKIRDDLVIHWKETATET